MKDQWESKIAAETSAYTAQQKIEELEKELESVQAEGGLEKTTFGQEFTKSKSHFLAIGAAASLGIGIVLSTDQNSQSASPLFLLLGAGSGAAALLRTSKAVQENNKNSEEKAKKIADIRRDLGEKRKEYSEQSRQVKTNPADIPNITIGSALLPLVNQEVLGSNFIVDPTGLVKPTKLRAIALRDLSNDAEDILERTRKLENIPALLKPNSESIAESQQSANTLHGEERGLREAVGSYVNTLSSISDEELNINAIKPNSELGEILKQALENNDCIVKDAGDNDITAVISANNADESERVRRFEELQKEAEAVAGVALGQLDQINSELKNLCTRYSQARKQSTNTLHTTYYQVLNRANWSAKKFYCPRTILSKSYLQALIGIDLDSSHTLDPDDLISRLNSDSFISSRLAKKPQIVDDLLRSHEAILEIMGSYQLIPDENGIVRAGAAADYILDQYNQELALFRQRLIEALTGSPNGFLGISESARLFYDPEREIWSSPVLPYTYTNTEVEQYGQVLRTDVELLIPLWEHLWTEKSDFRKTELFRTNESIQRMSEKEGEKIKQIGYQFQGDLREVRSNMFLAKADFDAKLQELEEYEEGVRELGMMDDNQLARLQSATQELETVNQETSGDSAGYEQILMLEPKNQLLRRQSKVHDPIDVIKSPDLLIEGGVDRGTRRLIYSDDKGTDS